ncbi:MAG: acyl-CoA dehydrogenase family protein [Beijerinckiaceae bacterium]|nr:acyl-CoA dehydrogenase family protein [Beijerinckiaceae bacterium]
MTQADKRIDGARAALQACERLLASAREAVRLMVTRDGRIDADLMEVHQRGAHGIAWLATYVQSIRELVAYCERAQSEGVFGELESGVTFLAISEYSAQCFGGIPMSQCEMVRPTDMNVPHQEAQHFLTPEAHAFIAAGNSVESRKRIASLLAALQPGALAGADGADETTAAMREEIRRFASTQVQPYAHEWHLANAYIPMDVLAKLSELGCFGLTIPEEYGGLALPKIAMCAVTEELSRAFIGVGSLGTRSEIAAELILAGGTAQQKARYLPLIASGDMLTTAVFTEPNTGSDLASLKTRAVRDGDDYVITGSKTWITHPVRADLMTLLARTNPSEPGYRGLSMFLVEKPRGSDEEPFPLPGMSGTEIEVLGYRGMKEYEIAFEGVRVPVASLLGGEEGQGFKQLMQTFESARIQTAARAVGVAQNALDLARRYASERIQFGKPLYAFPRIFDKIVMMAADIHAARQITYFAARAKDEGRRCDLEAGMAKLLAARVAWAAADNALQIHGGNGFALEYPVSRVLCDARILNIFEGAAEIQAQVIARRLLET